MGLLDRNKLAEVSESTGGDFATMEPGVHLCRVQAVRTEWDDSKGNHWTYRDKQYVKVILDVEEGPCAGEFSRDYWEGPEKDWGHTLYMSWTERALGMLKHTFRSFAEHNPGFDAEAALDAEQWQMFIGKLVSVYWSGEEYEGRNGVRLRVRPDMAVTEDDNVTPKVKRLDGMSMEYGEYKEYAALRDQREGRGAGAQSAQAAQPAPASAYDDDSIPF